MLPNMRQVIPFSLLPGETLQQEELLDHGYDLSAAESFLFFSLIL